MAEARGRHGKPKDDRQIRQALLSAAEELFSAHPYDQVSIRDLAALARVNSAMIHYYFRGKKELYYAFLEHSLGPVLKEMQAVLMQLEGSFESRKVQEYVERMIEIFASKPWFVRFVFREILLGQHDLQKFYVNIYARHTGDLLPRLLEGEQRRGRYSEDLDTRFASLSLLSMMLFPFIAEALAGPAFGIEYDARFRERLARHIVKLFENGALRAHSESSESKPVSSAMV